MNIQQLKIHKMNEEIYKTFLKKEIVRKTIIVKGLISTLRL